MTDPSIHTGWTSIDEEIVPVRTKQTPSQTSEDVGVHATPALSHAASANPNGLWLSAITGVWIVLLLVVSYVGIDTLRGSITGENAGATTIAITADGHFSPATVTIAAGNTLTLENQNKNPQVIKPKGTSALFPEQVLFEQKSYSFTIPVHVAGTYVYSSDTLPDDQTVTITVIAAIETQGGAVSSIPVSDMTNFPIPFGDSSQVVPAPSSSSAPIVSVTTPIPETTTQISDEPAVISLGEAAPSSTEATFGNNAIQANPYTVGTESEHTKIAEKIAGSAKKLHSGAPLALQQRYHARTNASTGSELWLALLPALALMGVAYRKMVVV